MNIEQVGLIQLLCSAASAQLDEGAGRYTWHPGAACSSI
jgi:hypothetical protein